MKRHFQYGNNYYWILSQKCLVCIENHIRLCKNKSRAFLLCFVIDLSDGAPTPFEDRSFLSFLDGYYMSNICSVFCWKINFLKEISSYKYMSKFIKTNKYPIYKYIILLFYMFKK